MKTPLTCSTLAVLLCIASCNGHDRQFLPGRGINPNVADKIILLDDPFDAPFPKDAVAIDKASVDGDLLTLNVTYGGGCKTHEFALYGSKGFMESHPVQASLFLSHDANGDMCEALIRQEVVFDLSPLKRLYKQGYPDDGPILLRITEPGKREPIEPLPLYEF